MRWFVVIAAILSGTPAWGLSVVIDSTSKPYPGVEVKHGHTTGPTRNFKVAYVSLCNDYVHVTATKPPSVRQTTGTWGASQGVQLAVNGDFFKYTVPPQVYGDAVGNGAHWPASLSGVDDAGNWYYPHYGWIAVGDGWVEFMHTEHVKANKAAFEAAGYTVDHGWKPDDVTTAIPPGTKALVSGFSALVIEGKTYTCPDPAKPTCFPDRGDMSEWHKRTAMGLSKDRQTLMFVVVTSSTSGAELAELVGKLGAWQAFNLDGGGSSTLWLASSGYVYPTSNIRAVANHWGVFAGSGSGKAKAPGMCHTDGGCFVTSVPGAEDALFKDFPPAWTGQQAAVAMWNHGITNGCGTKADPAFCPKCTLKRSHFAAFLVRAAGLPTSSPPDTPTFSDVPKGHTFYADIEAIAAADITNGCGGGKFCPDNPVSRGQAAKFLRKAAGWPTLNPGTPSYADTPTTSTFYADIERMKADCVVEGCGGGNFCPGDSIDRAHAALWLAKTFDLDGMNSCLDYCDEASCKGEGGCGAWSMCSGYADACDETGTQSRTCTGFDDCDALSLDPSCGAWSDGETQSCTRDTDGTVVEPYGPWSACDWKGPCDEEAAKSRARTVCAEGAPAVETQAEVCARVTEGRLVEPFGPWSACGGFEDACDASGLRVSTRLVCSGGASVEEAKPQVCFRSVDCPVEADVTEEDADAGDAGEDTYAEPAPDSATDAETTSDEGANGVVDTSSDGAQPGPDVPDLDAADDGAGLASDKGGCRGGEGGTGPGWLVLGLLVLAAISHQLRARRREAPVIPRWRGPEADEVVPEVRRICRREHAAEALVDPKPQPKAGEKWRLAGRS